MAVNKKDEENITHFGFEDVPESNKDERVGQVFSSVAREYDVMNDLMSAGLHRLWKRIAVQLSGVKPGSRVLDIAAGTGDLSRLYAKRVGDRGEVWMTDVNREMLSIGRDLTLDKGFMLPNCQCNAESLPFPNNYFDCVSVSFGLRNMTRKEKALSEMYRVIRKGGRLIILEFSRVWKPLEKIYDFYSFSVIPLMGRIIAKDEGSYRYLAESIRMHPDQKTLKEMMNVAGFSQAQFFNLAAGVVAVHRGSKD